MTESLENQIKTLMRDLEDPNTQLLTFSSGSVKFNSILRMRKLASNKGGLRYKKNDHNAATASKTVFVPTTDHPKYIPNLEPKKNGFVGQRDARRRRTRQSRDRYQLSHNFGPRFISTCFQCGELGRIRPNRLSVINS